jgi:hypothetical protein
MKLELDDKFSEFLTKKILSNYQNRAPRRGKWHVSDLLYPRYAVLNRRSPHTPSAEEVGFFFMGEGLHRFIQHILGEQNAEVKAEAMSVLASADFFDGATLIEFKTSRKWTIPETPQDEYIHQAALYAFIFGVRTVRIAVVYPTANRKWDGSSASTVEIRSWTVSFTEEDIEEIKEEIANLVRDMTKAFQDGDVSGLPACPDWKAGSVEYDSKKKEYFLKKRCPFYDVCKCGSGLQREVDYKNAHRRCYGKGCNAKRKLQEGGQPGEVGQEVAGEQGNDSSTERRE